MKMMVIIAHPNLKDSRANSAMAKELSNHSTIQVRKLYEEYPDGKIDIEREQQLLLGVDRIVLQFPFYWYSCPPLLKEWFDQVLTYGWAFGPGGEALKGKDFIVATTTGGPENEYRSGGRNWFTISEYLRPIQATINRCNGTFLPAFATYNADRATGAALKEAAKRYLDHILAPAEALYR
ncbi:glutathione-regulated potassium-efflux system ancillary protein KefG [Seinonella peptonophila]|uniref:Glutathione-regulated potassium-efflux system ancillary protein KefG n=1 Tax=Seinonella peptonophila TaxID=112248 RepID=A0A1M4ZB78_9BACL|nr:NAD(P)H-dependent oxidoreductase [Seinonella peptonophila]SHF14836.1 glutathione-regulated potassium-efflux system ancillary protein KefG [Seinonella peptonophila]